MIRIFAKLDRIKAYILVDTLSVLFRFIFNFTSPLLSVKYFSENSFWLNFGWAVSIKIGQFRFFSYETTVSAFIFFIYLWRICDA